MTITASIVATSDDHGTERRFIEDLLLLVEKHRTPVNIISATASGNNHGQVNLLDGLTIVLEAPETQTGAPTGSLEEITDFSQTPAPAVVEEPAVDQTQPPLVDPAIDVRPDPNNDPADHLGDDSVPVPASAPTEAAIEPTPALPLYTFEGADPSAIDPNVWPLADVVTIDAHLPLYHYANDIVGGAASGADGAAWHQYTGATTTV